MTVDELMPPYRNLTPSKIPTIPAPASEAERKMAKELEGRKWGAPRVPKEMK